jgi:hypothetical protein
MFIAKLFIFSCLLKVAFFEMFHITRLNDDFTEEKVTYNFYYYKNTENLT